MTPPLPTRPGPNPVFFLQAEDGIRYTSVTGVQTCALPISGDPHNRGQFAAASLPGDLDVPRCFAPRDLSLAVNWPRLCGSPVARTCVRTASWAPFLAIALFPWAPAYRRSSNPCTTPGEFHASQSTIAVPPPLPRSSLVHPAGSSYLPWRHPPCSSGNRAALVLQTMHGNFHPTAPGHQSAP